MELREGEASVWLLLGEGIGSQDAAFFAFVQGWVIIKVGLVFRVLEGFLVTWNLGDQTYGGRGGTGIPASVCAGSAILITPSSHVSMGLAGLWHCVWADPDLCPSLGGVPPGLTVASCVHCCFLLTPSVLAHWPALGG